MPRLINANKLRKDVLDLPNCYNGFSDTYDKAMILDLVDEQPPVDAIPVDFIWDRAEAYEKQWLEEDNHWCKNVAEALRALLEDWDGEVGGILEKYENS